MPIINDHLVNLFYAYVQPNARFETEAAWASDVSEGPEPPISTEVVEKRA